jgi:hypothetical protein
LESYSSVWQIFAFGLTQPTFRSLEPSDQLLFADDYSFPKALDKPHLAFEELFRVLVCTIAHVSSR